MTLHKEAVPGSEGFGDLQQNGEYARFFPEAMLVW